MKILYASSEAHPLMKTGGLGDVSASLPANLRSLKQDIRLIIPAYQQAKKRAGRLQVVSEIRVADSPELIRILAGQLPKTRLPLYLVDAPLFFDRAGDPYRGPDGQDWQDNHLRFALFNRTIVAVALDQAGLGWHPDILHCNDWQTGLAPALLHSEPTRPATVFTIHNLAYQGLFPMHILSDLRLPSEFATMHALEFHGWLSFIKGGLAFSDHLTTVSPTYAEEIRTAQFGYGLEGLLNYRAKALTGILNGVDYRIWDPRRDTLLQAQYGIDDITPKRVNKLALQTHFGLAPSADTPLVAHLGRLVDQKGVDLLHDALPDLLRTRELQVVILGTGEQRLEHGLEELARSFPDKVAVHIGYSEPLAHLLEGGADIFVMPSRFEPCGLNQMYSLRYGTVPVVRHTGGLADTVVDITPATLADRTANGFVFVEASAKALASALVRALSMFDDREAWHSIMRHGMSLDYSWKRSARAYLGLYKRLSRERSTTT